MAVKNNEVPILVTICMKLEKNYAKKLNIKGHVLYDFIDMKYPE